MLKWIGPFRKRTATERAPKPSPEPKTPIDRTVAEYTSMKRDQWLGLRTPWFTEGAKSWLASNVNRADKVLEFGAGRSTIFFAAQAARVTTVEASPDWFLWVYMYLYNNPDLMKRARLHFMPTEWNPSFENGKRRYWTENTELLDEKDVTDLERDLITAKHEGNNVLMFDGSLRGPVFVYQISQTDFSNIDMVIIDNTELGFNSIAGDFMIPQSFIRMDFVAGSKDDIPAHQNGKHITSIYVSPARLKNSIEVETETQTHLNPEQRAPFILGDPMNDAGFKRRLLSITQHIIRVTGEDFHPRLFR